MAGRKHGSHDPEDQKKKDNQAFFRLCHRLLTKSRLDDRINSALPSDEAGDDIRRTVMGLSFILEAMGTKLKSAHPGSIGTTGAVSAVELLNAIIHGYDHPIHAYISGSRSMIANRPMQSDMFSAKPYVYGAYRTLLHKYEFGSRPAASMVEACFSDSNISGIKANTIRATNDKLRPDLDDAANRIMDRLLYFEGSAEAMCRFASMQMSLVIDPPPIREVDV